MGSGESRFSRWFRGGSPDGRKDGNPNLCSPLSIQDDNRNRTDSNGEKYFSPISPAGENSDSAGAQHSFLEFLQRGKFNNLSKNQQKPQQMGENSNSASPAQANTGHMPSVEELEARLRQSGPPNGTTQLSPGPSGIRNIGSHQQDMLAFKKLLEQMSNDGSSAQNQHQQQQQQQPPSHEQMLQSNLPHHHPDMGIMQMINKTNHGIHANQSPMPIPPHPHQIEEFKKMFSFGPTPPQPQQQQGQQQSRQIINHPPEAMKKLLMGQQHGPLPPLPFLSPQNRVEILKRPDAQTLLQSKFTYNVPPYSQFIPKINVYNKVEYIIT